MLVFTIVLFIFALFFLTMGILIYRGHTNLIVNYKQTKVKDQKRYINELGRALIGAGLVFLIASLVTFSYGEEMLITVMSVLIVGLGIAIGCLIYIQIKYNDGLF